MDYRKIQNFIKSPKFSAERNQDISMILNLVKVGVGGKSFGSEKEQLKSTLEGCTDNTELRDFFFLDEERKEFYEKNKNRLNFGLQLNNVNNPGDSDEYSVRLTIDWKSYNLKMYYSSPNKNLYTYKFIPVFNASRVMSSYDVWVQIRDEDRDIVYSTSKRVVTNATSNTSTTTTNTNTNTTTNTVTNAEIEVKAFRYIYSVEQRFTSPVARTAYLNRTISALESVRYSVNTTVVDGIIQVLRERIASYSTGSTNSGNTNTGNTYVPRAPWINKAESIKSDGQGGTFRYVGGYNY